MAFIIKNNAKTIGIYYWILYFKELFFLFTLWSRECFKLVSCLEPYLLVFNLCARLEWINLCFWFRGVTHALWPEKISTLVVGQQTSLGYTIIYLFYKNLLQCKPIVFLALIMVPDLKLDQLSIRVVKGFKSTP